MIGIIGEYVTRIYNEVKNRPNYIIDEIIEEPIGGAHRDYKTISQHVKRSLLSNIENLNKIPLERLLERRYLRLTEIGK